VGENLCSLADAFTGTGSFPTAFRVGVARQLPVHPRHLAKAAKTARSLAIAVKERRKDIQQALSISVKEYRKEIQQVVSVELLVAAVKKYRKATQLAVCAKHELIQIEDGFVKLFHACGGIGMKSSNTEEALELILAGCPPNHDGSPSLPFGVTLLIIATGNRDTEIVKALIGAGARLHDKDKNGNTALSASASPQIVEALTAAGAKC
jgi:ankyrin repeat protein